MIETNLPVLLLKELILLPFNEIRIEISKGEDKKVLNITLPSFTVSVGTDISSLLNSIKITSFVSMSLILLKKNQV